MKIHQLGRAGAQHRWPQAALVEDCQVDRLNPSRDEIDAQIQQMMPSPANMQEPMTLPNFAPDGNETRGVLVEGLQYQEHTPSSSTKVS